MKVGGEKVRGLALMIIMLAMGLLSSHCQTGQEIENQGVDTDSHQTLGEEALLFIMEAASGRQIERFVFVRCV